MDRHELNRMFDGLAPDPGREQVLLRQLLQENARRKISMKNWKRIVIGVAAAALLVTGATAAYQIFRQEVSLEPDKTISGILGGGQPSWERTEVYNEYGVLEANWPNREIAEVDPAQAQALLEDYLPECGYQWELGEYTFTMEGYVLDENTGIAKFYYSIEHPSGFGEDAVDWEHGTLSYKSGINVSFETQSDISTRWFGMRSYMDVGRSTGKKLYMVDAVGSEFGWKAEDGFVISFVIRGETDMDDDILSVKLELPGLKSLPTVSVADPVTGETVVEMSSISLALKTGGDMDLVDYIALDYADGTRYVVRDDANSLDNADYGFICGERPDRELHLCFNRLVDPSQVTAVIVDNQRYEVN